MLKIILQNRTPIFPFNEPARDLRLQNKPLWLLQRDLLAACTHQELEVAAGPAGYALPEVRDACLVYEDNLFFDDAYLQAFIGEARKVPWASRAAFSNRDPAFREHVLPLSTSFTPSADHTLANLWYYPSGTRPDTGRDVRPLVIDLQAREIGYYHIPAYMARPCGDLVYQVPLRSLMAIDSWVHVFLADIVFGLFARGARFEEGLKRSPLANLRLLGKAMLEGRQVLESSGVVHVGKNCSIDPTAVIHGPTTIGDNVTVGAGAVIENCILGSSVNISQGCQVMLSVIGDGTFLPFRAGTFMSTVMDNSMIAQNSCLQMCVVGRSTFIGAGTTFTDYNLLPVPIHARAGSRGELQPSNRPVLGGCVGHNCRLGAGLVIYPGRVVESDVVLVPSSERRVIDHDVSYAESDHHRLPIGDLHKRLYPPVG